MQHANNARTTANAITENELDLLLLLAAADQGFRQLTWPARNKNTPSSGQAVDVDVF